MAKNSSVSQRIHDSLQEAHKDLKNWTFWKIKGTIQGPLENDRRSTPWSNKANEKEEANEEDSKKKTTTKKTKKKEKKKKKEKETKK